jgi:hypothetical protein
VYCAISIAMHWALIPEAIRVGACALGVAFSLVATLPTRHASRLIPVARVARGVCRFQLALVNAAGVSAFSEPTNGITTLAYSDDETMTAVVGFGGAVAMSTTVTPQVRLRWHPPPNMGSPDSAAIVFPLSVVLCLLFCLVDCGERFEWDVPCLT